MKISRNAVMDIKTTSDPPMSYSTMFSFHFGTHSDICWGNIKLRCEKFCWFLLLISYVVLASWLDGASCSASKGSFGSSFYVNRVKFNTCFIYIRIWANYLKYGQSTYIEKHTCKGFNIKLLAEKYCGVLLGKVQRNLAHWSARRKYWYIFHSRSYGSWMPSVLRCDDVC